VNRQQPTDFPASVQARLLRRTRATGEVYQSLFLAFVAERFLYRLGRSSVRDRFVLKGAMLLRAWSDQPYRATRDLDLLRRGGGSDESMRSDVETICKTEIEPDGLAFDASSIEVESIRAETEYVGTRLTVVVRSGKARVTFQIDVGVGDAVWPEPQRRPYPTLSIFLLPKC
jgi:Nucleotidyl transferase AbiEii toxin, Type IV TA system